MKRWALMLALVLAAGCSAGSDTEAELRAEIAELRAEIEAERETETTTTSTTTMTTTTTTTTTVPGVTREECRTRIREALNERIERDQRDRDRVQDALYEDDWDTYWALRALSHRRIASDIRTAVSLAEWHDENCRGRYGFDDYEDGGMLRTDVYSLMELRTMSCGTDMECHRETTELCRSVLRPAGLRC